MKNQPETPVTSDSNISLPPSSQPILDSQLTTHPQPNLPLILMVIFLLFLFGTGGLFLGKYLSSPRNIPVPTVAPKPTTIPTVTPDQTVYTEGTRSANWKTYTNKVLGYSISYPANYFKNGEWDTKDLPKDTNLKDIASWGDLSISSYDVNTDSFSPPPNGLELGISFSGSKYSPPEEYKKTTVTTLGKIQASKLTSLVGEKSISGKELYEDSYYIKHKSGLIKISSRYTSEFKAISDQILSTFQFLD